MSRQAEGALLNAAERGDLATLKRLVEEGVDLEAKGYPNGLTALMLAAKYGKLDCLELLIAKGAKLDATNIGGFTALMIAAGEGNLDCLEHLIAKGAKLDAKSNTKMTALHYAAYLDHAPCVEALLKAGADARLKDQEGDTALDDAKVKGHTQVIALLENAAAVAAQLAWTLDPADLHAAELLGRGSQSDVLHGKWQGLLVAIKQPRVSGAAGSEFLRREVRALSRVQHPNVVRLYGVCSEPQPCVVMAYAAGGALADQIATRPSSLLEDARLLRGIASGMACIHAHNILHLDLKPQNVLITGDGTPLVTDFGLSTSLGSSGTSSTGAAMRGTLPYRPPEAFRSKRQGGAVVSPATDVYAFAVLSWQVLTRQEPWAELESAETEIGLNVRDGYRPELRDESDWRKASASAAALAPIVEACWAQEHTARPAFGGDGGVAARLEAVEAAASAEAAAGDKAAAEAELEAAAARVREAEEEKEQLRKQHAEMQAALEAEQRERSLQQQGFAELRGMLEGLQVAQKTAEEEARTAREQLLKQPHGASKDADLREEMREMQVQMQKQLQMQMQMQMKMFGELLSGQQQQAMMQQQATRLLGAIAMGELDCPRVPWLQPVKVKGRERLSPKSWYTKQFRLFFLCPVTCDKAETNDGEGYLVEMPKDWVVKYGPAIKVGVQVLKLALASGRIAGLPLPALPQMKELIINAEHEAVAQLEALMAEKMGEVKGETEAEFESAMNLDAEPVPGVTAEKAKGVTGASFRALRALIEKQDPQLQRTGLVKMQSQADKSFEWVSEHGSAKFKKEGQRALLAVARA